jgi:hypothetical protein
MDKAELLSEFTSRVDMFGRYQGFIDKAKSQAGRFTAAVVEKVIADNSSKAMKIVEEIVPLMADLEGVIESLEGDREGVITSAKDSQFKLEELELRHMIGDLSDETFEAESSEVKSIVEAAEAQVAVIDAELDEFRGEIARWNELGKAAGVLEDGDEDPEPDAEPEPEPEPADEDDASLSDAELEFDESEDLELSDDAEEAAGDSLEIGDLDILGDDEDDDEDELDLEPGDSVVEADQTDKPRRAVLLYQEGTAEEQIYPFTGEVLSLGRGRDNDVQVKNDSKVSRYHCKLYRRGPNFYIEDNKSANGTLVNGELITERRLFGGEEVIIGETFFRFRILD